jgi:hypothetical protein
MQLSRIPSRHQLGVAFWQPAVQHWLAFVANRAADRQTLDGAKTAVENRGVTTRRRLPLRLGALAATIVAAAAALSILWWRGWMYAGWPGSPGVLARLLSADGEAAYDAYAAEMFLILLASFIIPACRLARK